MKFKDSVFALLLLLPSLGLAQATPRPAAPTAKPATANRITQLAAQMDDWEQQTLKAHSAADGKHKVDWTKGTIVTKETP